MTYVAVFASICAYVALGYLIAKQRLRAYKYWGERPFRDFIVFPVYLVFRTTPAEADHGKLLEDTPEGLQERAEYILLTMLIWLPVYVILMAFMLVFAPILFVVRGIPYLLTRALRSSTRAMRI